MDFTLATVTALALALAIGMTMLAWRLIRDERRRSAARIAALAAELAETGPDPSSHEPPPRALVARQSTVDSRQSSVMSRQASVDGRPSLRASQVPAQRPRPVDPIADAPIRPATGAVARIPMEPVSTGQVLFANAAPGVEDEPAEAADTSEALFATAQRPSRGNWKLAVACLALVAIVGAVAVTNFTGLSRPSSGAEPTVAASAAPALELMSLRHTRQGTTLTITGLVRNPVAGRAVQRLSAVAFLFDRSGAFVVSGRAPLDFTTLGPGDESPFVISLDAPAGVSRYRVSFRTDSGAVMPHADRRDAAAPATPEKSTLRAG